MFNIFEFLPKTFNIQSDQGIKVWFLIKVAVTVENLLYTGEGNGGVWMTCDWSAQLVSLLFVSFRPEVQLPCPSQSSVLQSSNFYLLLLLFLLLSAPLHRFTYNYLNIKPLVVRGGLTIYPYIYHIHHWKTKNKI